MPKDAVLRVARPTDRLDKITRMYAEGLGFQMLSTFEGHNGFDIATGQNVDVHRAVCSAHPGRHS